MEGKLYLVPVTLGGPRFKDVIPETVLDITKRLRYFVVEEIRTARRYLRLIDSRFPIDDTHFYELNEHTHDKEIEQYLDPVSAGHDIGLMSEAGLPGIADPGSRLVTLAHRMKIKVVPLTGPSSILLALISSGLNGQNFSFNGYLPVKPADRSARIKLLEKKAHEGYSQIFMETPYRAGQLLSTVLRVCHNDTLLCLAVDITLTSESVITKKISEWKMSPPDLSKKLVVFVIR